MNKNYIIVALAVLLAAVSLQAQNKKGMAAKKGAAPFAGHMLEMMDTDKDGKVSKSEWQAHHDKRFAAIDADNDGFITTAEMKAHHASMRDKRQEMCPDCPYSKKGMGKGPRRKAAEDDSE